MVRTHQTRRIRFQINPAGRHRLEAVPGFPAEGPTGRARWRAQSNPDLMSSG